MLPEKSLAQRAEELTGDELNEAVAPLLEETGYRMSGFRYPLDKPIFYIKFAITVGEVKTQRFVFDALKQMPAELTRGVHVPQILRVIETPRWTFVAMEYVHGKTLFELQGGYGYNKLLKREYDEVARGLELLLSIPAPPGADLGPIGGGIIIHEFFKDCEAPVVYDSVDMLEKHINKIVNLTCKDQTVTFERDLHLVYSDLYSANFIFTDSGDLCIIDFGHVAFLPLSFMTFALYSPLPKSRAVAYAVRDQLNLPQQNLQAMCYAADTILRSSTSICLPVDSYDNAKFQ